MILMNNIIDESNANIHKKCIECRLPLSFKDKRLAKELIEYVRNSITPEIRDRFNLREAVGLAAPQINVLKQMFAIYFYDIDETFYNFVAVNPEIIEVSKELIYLPEGEGCLSVNRETDNLLTPRHKEITARFLKIVEGEKPIWVTQTFKDYPAIVFQHEYDHLQGTLFADKMFKELPDAKPVFDLDKIRAEYQAKVDAVNTKEIK